jgi:hypothetical protein
MASELVQAAVDDFVVRSRGVIYGTAIFDEPTEILNPILIHELAHQRYGDSVSPYSWSDAWQNEATPRTTS